MIPVLDPISNRISLYFPASTRTWLSMSLYLVVVPKRGLVPSMGREVMTVLRFPYGPMLCSRFTRLQLTVRYRKPSWMSTGRSLMWGVCRTIGGSVSQNTREILESCGICSLSKVNPYPSIRIFLKC